MIDAVNENEGCSYICYTDDMRYRIVVLEYNNTSWLEFPVNAKKFNTKRRYWYDHEEHGHNFIEIIIRNSKSNILEAVKALDNNIHEIKQRIISYTDKELEFKEKALDDFIENYLNMMLFELNEIK